VTAPEEMAAALEAILFVATEPVPRQRLLEVFEESEREAAAVALEQVLERYQANGEGAGRRGVRLEEVAGGLRLATDPSLHGYLKRFFQVGDRSRLSMAALETLAIIAYRQPLTAPEIQELRGVQSNAVLKTLLERRLIRIAGRKPVVGKPFIYRTSREFLLHFGLASIEDLPPLEELEELLVSEVGGVEGDREEEILRLAVRLEEAEGDAAAGEEDDEQAVAAWVDEEAE
jgi:segregation and condensation protein B